MRHQILLRKHQLSHTLSQPLLYAHSMAACQNLHLAPTWTYFVVVNNKLNVSAPEVVNIVLLVEELAAFVEGHCSVCATRALFVSNQANDCERRQERLLHDAAFCCLCALLSCGGVCEESVVCIPKNLGPRFWFDVMR